MARDDPAVHDPRRTNCRAGDRTLVLFRVVGHRQALRLAAPTPTRGSPSSSSRRFSPARQHLARGRRLALPSSERQHPHRSGQALLRPSVTAQGRADVGLVRPGSTNVDTRDGSRRIPTQVRRRPRHGGPPVKSGDFARVRSGSSQNRTAGRECRIPASEACWQRWAFTSRTSRPNPSTPARPPLRPRGRV